MRKRGGKPKDVSFLRPHDKKKTFAPLKDRPKNEVKC